MRKFATTEWQEAVAVQKMTPIVVPDERVTNGNRINMLMSLFHMSMQKLQLLFVKVVLLLTFMRKEVVLQMIGFCNM
jgi:hypothetical protein